MVLGLARHVVVTVSEVRRMLRQAGDKDVAYRRVLLATVKWLFPVTRFRQRVLYSVTTLTFHVAVIVVPIFLAGHIALVQAGIGVSWPGIPHEAADVLTIIAVVTALLLIAQRVLARDSRSLSRFQDYALPIAVAAPFVSGFLVVHTAWNPFPFDATLLVHVLTADALLVLIPVTKLSHIVLLPAAQLVSELAWHFPPDAGERVGMQLGREGHVI
jgi:nitrate reductase gamma subunit